MFTSLANKGLAIGLCLLSSTSCGARVSRGVAQAPDSQGEMAANRTSVPPPSEERAVAAPSGDEATASGLARVAAGCSGTGCRPPREIVSRLCAGKNPSVAVAMFAASSPWQRSYIRVQQVDPINTLGGPSSEKDLVFDEEVIVLDGLAGAPTEVSVSGSNGHHVLRFDGTCATVMDDELTQRRPPAPRHAQLNWGHLDTDLQQALLEDPDVKKARRTQRAACRGSSQLNADASCAEAQQRLGDAIVKAIQRPVALPDVAIVRL